MNVGGIEHSRQRNFITSDEIAKIQSIGRKSVNVLTSEENEMLKKYAARYWMELKTKSPFFRAWFGDWRANDTSEVQIARERNDARGAQINMDTNWRINVSGKVFNETKAHQQAQNKAAHAYLPFIGDIVKKAILLDSHTVDKAKSPNTLLMHSFYAVADIGSGPEVLKLYVEEMYDPNSADTAKRAYQLKNIEKKQPSAKGSGNALAQSISTTNVHNVSDLFALVKHLDDAFAPNEVSAVSKNGQPITVYHGSGAVFDEFSYDFMSTHGSMEGQGFYFTDNKNMAEGYAKEGGQLLEGYLSIKKPLSDSEKTLTKAEVKRLLKEIDPTGDDVILNYDPRGGMGYPSDAWYQRSLNAATDMIYSGSDTDSELLADIANSGAGSETVLRTVRQALGYDGYIVEGKYDNATVYVAFESSQFKSVNNVGTFDPQNPNFYYSRITFSDPDAYVDKDGKVMEYSYTVPELKKCKQDFIEKTKTSSRIPSGGLFYMWCEQAVSRVLS